MFPWNLRSRGRGGPGRRGKLAPPPLSTRSNPTSTGSPTTLKAVRPSRRRLNREAGIDPERRNDPMAEHCQPSEIASDGISLA
jgi:hypothetical protein